MIGRYYVGLTLGAVAGLFLASRPVLASIDASFYPDWRIETFLTPSPPLLSPLMPNQPERIAAPRENTAEPRARIAIIIDDLGNQWYSALRTLRLPGPITLAILPDSHWGQKLARRAQVLQREIMVHVPMEPADRVDWQSGLTTTMDENELRESLEKMLRAFPQASGINNHMGSSLTRNRTPMNWVMHLLAERNLYFIDSRTIPETEGFSAALAGGIPTMERDIFLDHERSESAIEGQWQALTDIALEDGYALAIGHPYPETLNVLERNIPGLFELGIELVSVSDLLAAMDKNLDSTERRRVAANRWRELLEPIPILLNQAHLKSI